MMKKKILVIGRNDDILAVLDRLINKNENWQGVVTNNDEKAIAMFQQEIFDMVLFSSGIDERCEGRLRTAFTLHNPSIIIVQHFGGGSGLLENEIRIALGI